MELTPDKMSEILNLLNFEIEGCAKSFYGHNKRFYKEFDLVLKGKISDFFYEVIQERLGFFKIKNEHSKCVDSAGRELEVGGLCEIEITDPVFFVSESDLNNEEYKSASMFTFKSRDESNRLTTVATSVENEIFYTCLNLIDLLFKNKRFLTKKISLKKILYSKGMLFKCIHCLEMKDLIQTNPKLRDCPSIKRRRKYILKNMNISESRNNLKNTALIRRLVILLAALDRKNLGLMNIKQFKDLLKEKINFKELGETRMLDETEKLDLTEILDNTFSNTISDIRSSFGISNPKAKNKKKYFASQKPPSF